MLDGKEYNVRTTFAAGIKAIKRAAAAREGRPTPHDLMPANYEVAPLVVPHTKRKLTQEEVDRVLAMTGWRRNPFGTFSSGRRVRRESAATRTATAVKPERDAFDPTTPPPGKKAKALPPMICGGKPFDLRNPPACFRQELGAMLDAQFAAKAKLVAAGGTACKPNPDGSKTLSPHQRGVFEIARVLLANGMQRMKGCRGLMCYHSVGSGKTVVALSILIAALTSGQKYTVYLVTTPENSRNNSASLYAENLLEYFPDQVHLFGMEKPARGENIKTWASLNAAKMAAKMKTVTYTSTAWYDKGLGPNTIMIMDESQNLYVQAGTLARSDLVAKAAGLRELLLTEAVRKNTYVFLLSGTPSAGSTEGFAMAASLVRPLGTPPLKPSDPPSRFRGIISYVEVREDRSMFGQLGRWTGSRLVPTKGTFHQRVLNQFYEMGAKYYASFLKSVAKEAETEYDKGAPDKFFKKLAEKASVLVASDAGKTVDMAAAKEAKLVVTGGRSTFLLSNKLVHVLKNITSMPGKQFVYAANPKIAKAIESALQQIYGYQRVGLSQIDLEVKHQNDGGGGAKKKEPKLWASGKNPKRYMTYGTGQRDDPREKFEKVHIWGMKQLMKHPDNLNGEYCKIMVAMQSNYEGLDIPAWRGVHIVQPLATKDRDEQALGRALRACGHSALPPEQRVATIIRYYSVAPRKFDPDALDLKDTTYVEEALKKLREVGLRKGRTSPNVIVFEDAQMRQQRLDRFEQCMQQQAVDCPLLKKGLMYAHTCGGPCGGGRAPPPLTSSGGAPVPSREDPVISSGRRPQGKPQGKPQKQSKVSAPPGPVARRPGPVAPARRPGPVAPARRPGMTPSPSPSRSPANPQRRPASPSTAMATPQRRPGPVAAPQRRAPVAAPQRRPAVSPAPQRRPATPVVSRSPSRSPAPPRRPATPATPASPAFDAFAYYRRPRPVQARR